MLQLENAELRVELLHPVEEAARLGPRFCAGGFVWQVHDRQRGPLLSGPEYPKADPLPFNGQGLPESFRHQTLEGQPLTWRDREGLALGAGRLRRDDTGHAVLAEPATWQMEIAPRQLAFATADVFAGIDYALTREVDLAGRTLQSVTTLTNRSADAPLALQWFAHPFFPLVNGLTRVALSNGATLGENPGFELTAGILTQKRSFVSAGDGHMERSLRLPAGDRLHAVVAHPVIGRIVFETSFAPDAHVIWGNDRTFSIEPYLHLTLAPGETRSWWVRFVFGERPTAT